MYLGQAIIYLNKNTVQRFTVTARQAIPELGLKAGNFRAFSLYDEALKGDVLNREVISIDCVNNLVNFEIEWH